MQCLRLRCLARRKVVLNVPLVGDTHKGRGSLFKSWLVAGLAKKNTGEGKGQGGSDSSEVQKSRQRLH